MSRFNLIWYAENGAVVGKNHS